MVNMIEDTPTIHRAHNFNANENAAILKKAMDENATDEKAIIDVLTNMNNDQRLKVAEAYKNLFEKELVKDFKSELSGNFLHLILALISVPADFIAQELKKAEEEADEESIVEIFCTIRNCKKFDVLVNNKISCLKNDTRPIINSDGEIQIGENIEKRMRGQLKRLLLTLSKANFDETIYYEPEVTVDDAKALYEAENGQWGAYERRLNELLLSRDYQYLQKTFEEYKKFSGKDIEVGINNEFSDGIKEALIGVVRFIKSKHEFFAQKLYDNLNRLGSDRNLIRIIVLRSEIDLVEIKAAFEKRYGKSLGNFIKDKTCGAYRTALLSLISHKEIDPKNLEDTLRKRTHYLCSASHVIED